MNWGKAYFLSAAIAALAMLAGDFLRLLRVLDASAAGIIFFSWLLWTVVIAAICLAPFLVVAQIANRFAIRSPFYFTAAAILTAAMLTALVTLLVTPTGPPGDPERMEFAEAVTRYLGFTLPGGLAGGIAFWFFGIHLQST